MSITSIYPNTYKKIVTQESGSVGHLEDRLSLFFNEEWENFLIDEETGEGFNLDVKPSWTSSLQPGEKVGAWIGVESIAHWYDGAGYPLPEIHNGEVAETDLSTDFTVTNPENEDEVYLCKYLPIGKALDKYGNYIDFQPSLAELVEIRAEDLGTVGTKTFWWAHYRDAGYGYKWYLRGGTNYEPASFTPTYYYREEGEDYYNGIRTVTAINNNFIYSDLAGIVSNQTISIASNGIKSNNAQFSLVQDEQSGLYYYKSNLPITGWGGTGNFSISFANNIKCQSQTSSAINSLISAPGESFIMITGLPSTVNAPATSIDIHIELRHSNIGEGNYPYKYSYNRTGSLAQGDETGVYYRGGVYKNKGYLLGLPPREVHQETEDGENNTVVQVTLREGTQNRAVAVELDYVNEAQPFMQGFYYLEEYNKYLIIRAVDDYILLDDETEEVNYTLQASSGNSTIYAFIADTNDYTNMELPVWSSAVAGVGVFDSFKLSLDLPSLRNMTYGDGDMYLLKVETVTDKKQAYTKNADGTQSMTDWDIFQLPYGESDAGTAIQDLQANKEDKVTIRSLYGSYYDTPPGIATLTHTSANNGTRTVTTNPNTQTILWQNYYTYSEAAVYDIGSIINISMRLNRTGQDNRQSLVVTEFCLFTGDINSQTDRENPALYTNVGGHSTTIELKGGISLSKGLLINERLEIAAGAVLSICVKVTSSETSQNTHSLIISDEYKLIASRTQQGISLSSSTIPDTSPVGGATIADSLSILKAVTDYQASTQETITIDTTDWTALSDKSPFTVVATAIVVTPLFEDSIVNLVGLDIIAQANFGIIPVETITGQTLTLYAMTTPDTDMTFSLEIRRAEVV